MSGFFQGKKGLKQGDPISFQLLVIAMDYFSRIPAIMRKREDFNYHYRCNHLKLNHLIFADDLMLFCKGEVNFVVLMVKALKAYSEVSSLFANKKPMDLYIMAKD